MYSSKRCGSKGGPSDVESKERLATNVESDVDRTDGRLTSFDVRSLVSSMIKMYSSHGKSPKEL
jgi:hypothetical protein